MWSTNTSLGTSNTVVMVMPKFTFIKVFPFSDLRFSDLMFTVNVTMFATRCRRINESNDKNAATHNQKVHWDCYHSEPR